VNRLMQMNGRFLTDTNIIIALFALDLAVQRRLKAAEEVFLASPVLGELYFGARKSNRVLENVARIDQLAQRSSILHCDLETAKWYGIIKNELRTKGRPIPENDIWMAAIAFQHELILVTRDSHFDAIDDLHVQRW